MSSSSNEDREFLLSNTEAPLRQFSELVLRRWLPDDTLPSPPSASGMWPLLPSSNGSVSNSSGQYNVEMEEYAASAHEEIHHIIGSLPRSHTFSEEEAASMSASEGPTMKKCSVLLVEAPQSSPSPLLPTEEDGASMVKGVASVTSPCSSPSFAGYQRRIANISVRATNDRDEAAEALKTTIALTPALVEVTRTTLSDLASQDHELPPSLDRDRQIKNRELRGMASLTPQQCESGMVEGYGPLEESSGAPSEAFCVPVSQQREERESEEEVYRLRRQLYLIQRENAVKEKCIAQQAAEMQENEVAMRQLQGLVESHDECRQSAMKHVEELSAQLASLLDVHEELQRRHGVSQAKLAAVQHKYDETCARQEREDEDRAVHQKEAHQRIAALETQLSNFQREIETHTADAQKIDTQLVETKEQLQCVKRCEEACKANVEILTAENASLKVENEKLLNSIQKMKSEVVELPKRQAAGFQQWWLHFAEHAAVADVAYRCLCGSLATLGDLPAQSATDITAANTSVASPPSWMGALTESSVLAALESAIEAAKLSMPGLLLECKGLDASSSATNQEQMGTPLHMSNATVLLLQRYQSQGRAALACIERRCRGEAANTVTAAAALTKSDIPQLRVAMQELEQHFSVEMEKLQHRVTTSEEQLALAQRLLGKEKETSRMTFAPPQGLTCVSDQNEGDPSSATCISKLHQELKKAQKETALAQRFLHHEQSYIANLEKEVASLRKSAYSASVIEGLTREMQQVRITVHRQVRDAVTDLCKAFSEIERAAGSCAEGAAGLLEEQFMRTIQTTVVRADTLLEQAASYCFSREGDNGVQGVAHDFLRYYLQSPLHRQHTDYYGVEGIRERNAHSYSSKSGGANNIPPVSQQVACTVNRASSPPISQSPWLVQSPIHADKATHQYTGRRPVEATHEDLSSATPTRSVHQQRIYEEMQRLLQGNPSNAVTSVDPSTFSQRDGEEVACVMTTSAPQCSPSSTKPIEGRRYSPTASSWLRGVRPPPALRCSSPTHKYCATPKAYVGGPTLHGDPTAADLSRRKHYPLSSSDLSCSTESLLEDMRSVAVQLHNVQLVLLTAQDYRESFDAKRVAQLRQWENHITSNVELMLAPIASRLATLRQPDAPVSSIPGRPIPLETALLTSPLRAQSFQWSPYHITAISSAEMDLALPTGKETVSLSEPRGVAFDEAGKPLSKELAHSYIDSGSCQKDTVDATGCFSSPAAGSNCFIDSSASGSSAPPLSAPFDTQQLLSSTQPRQAPRQADGAPAILLCNTTPLTKLPLLWDSAGSSPEVTRPQQHNAILYRKRVE